MSITKAGTVPRKRQSSRRNKVIMTGALRLLKDKNSIGNENFTTVHNL